ncbi:MAG: TonB-dependent receptor [Deltaproteobacteria bacterium]|nr:TonB-dependent receptor [Deltaproteobacteria bacterium]
MITKSLAQVCSKRTCLSTIVMVHFFLLFLLCPDIGDAQNAVKNEEEPEERPRFELDEIVVTATREEDEIRKIPKNVTVITSEDIEQASSNNIVDLLARESNVNLRSFFGHDKRAGVDIRGMGDTFVSNVVVMVDGFRLNSPDLAGPDFSSIPLDQIERIEIVRGAGSVLYGDGAVGGVINIITKKGQKDTELRLHGSCGSYGTYDSRVSLGGRIRDFSFNVNAEYYDSEGYRDNGYLRKKDAALQLGYDLGDLLHFSLGASKHDGRYGFPGPVSKEDIDSEERRVLTDHPYDFGEVSDERYTGGIEVDFKRWGVIRAQCGYRHSYNPFIIGFTPLLSKEDQLDVIEEKTKHLNVGYNAVYKLGGLEHKFQCGMDYYQTDYSREDKLTEIKLSDVENIGYFLTSEWSLPKDFVLSAGYRKDKNKGVYRTDTYEDFFNPNPPFNYLFSSWVIGAQTEKIWRNEAFDFGLTYLPTSNTTLFASCAKSFRNPNVDELAEADDDLHPQKGMHLDVGARQRIGDFIELSVTIFQIKIKDEIYYGEDPVTLTSINRNYDEKTLRRGLETDVKMYPFDFLYLWGNYSYTEAKFENRETYIPLVPAHKAAIGLELRLMDSLLLALTGTWVGSRYDGNDEENKLYEKLEGYKVFEVKLTYEYKALKIFFGTNNIFNELYSTTAYSETYYPMPERSFYGGLEWKF